MTLYIRPSAQTTVTVQSPRETISLTDSTQLRTLGRSLQQSTKSIAIAQKELSEAIRDRRELIRELNDRASNRRRWLKKRYGSLKDPRAQAEIQRLEQQKVQALAAQDARIQKERASVEERTQQFNERYGQYDEKTIKTAYDKAPKAYRTGGTRVASLADLRSEAQRQASDKALLAEVQERPGIIKPGQLKSQYYSAKYGGGTYTSLGEGSYNGVTVRQTTAGYSKLEGGSGYARVPTPSPSTRTVFALPLDEQNRAAIREAATSGRYRNVGEIFGAAQFTERPVQETIKPGQPLSFSERMALSAMTYEDKYKNETDPFKKPLYRLQAGTAYIGLTATETASQGKAFISGLSFGAVWRGAETTFSRMAQRGGKSKAAQASRFFGTAGKIGGKVATPVFLGLYAYDYTKSRKSIASMPEDTFSDRLAKTRARAGLSSKVLAESVGFSTGYKTVSAVVPLRAYSTTTSTPFVDIFGSRKRTMVSGVRTEVLMVGKPTVKSYYGERFQGIRGWFNGQVRTVTTVNPSGRVTRRQYARNAFIVTNQPAGAKTSTMTVYKRTMFGRQKTITYRGDNLRETFSGGPAFDLVESRFRRREKGYAGDTVLLQAGKRVSTYGFAQRIGRGTYIIGTGRGTSRVVAISESTPTPFLRSISQVGKIVLKPRARGRIKGFSFFTPNQRIKAYGKPRVSAYGLRDTVLRTAPESVVSRQSYLTARASKETTVPEGTSAYPIKTLLAPKGAVTTRIAYTETFYGRIEIARLGKAPKVAPLSTDMIKQRAQSIIYNPPAQNNNIKFRSLGFRDASGELFLYSKRPSIFLKNQKNYYSRQYAKNRAVSTSGGYWVQENSQRIFNEMTATQMQAANRLMPEVITKELIINTRLQYRQVSVSRLSGRGLAKGMTINAPVRLLARPRSRAVVASPIATKASQNARMVPRTANIPRSATIPRTQAIPRAAIISTSRLASTSIAASRLTTTTLTTTRITPYNPPTIIRFPVPRVTPIVPTMGGGFFMRAGPETGGSRRSLRRQQKAYTPSLFAIGTGVKGKAPRKGLLGFSIRPIRG